ncbi:PucR family transcriptional regulator [Mycobacterium sp. NPDC003449]
MDTCLRSVSDDDLDFHAVAKDVTARSSVRVAEGLPLRSYLRCLQIGYAVLNERLEAEFGDDMVLARPVLNRVRSVYDELIGDGVAAYELPSRKLPAEEQDRHARTIDALFTGIGIADGFDVADAVPARPLVALLAVETTSAERQGSARARALASTRKVRGIRDHFDRGLGNLWLMDIRPDSGRLILQGYRGPLSAVAAEAGARFGVVISIAVAESQGVDDIPRAAQLAREVLDTALRCGRKGVLSAIDDVALEHHLARSGPGRDVLLGRSEALVGRALLIDTLRGYLHNNLDRRATADALAVHPNTIDNRINRIRELTGLDVHVVRDLITLAVAVNTALEPS